jgi:hypothetical protein
MPAALSLLKNNKKYTNEIFTIKSGDFYSKPEKVY